jgi:2Fe-2S ferredoxin
MANVVVVAYDGHQQRVDAPEGASVHVGGGSKNHRGNRRGRRACACATCHAYIPEAWRTAVRERSEFEAQMLALAEGVASNSRLACQLHLSPALDELVVQLPASQH